MAVVGGGFGGVGAVVMLKRAGFDDVTIFERSERVGGVWNDNTYPGAACDVPSHLYEFSFDPNPRWSRRYAPQAEIQAYVEDVARRYGVTERIRTGTRVDAARWDESRRKWQLETSAGPHEADVLVTAGRSRTASIEQHIDREIQKLMASLPNPDRLSPEERRGVLISYRTGDIWSPHVEAAEPLQNVVRHFAECVREGKRPLTDGESGLHVVRILEAAQRSIKAQGGRITL